MSRTKNVALVLVTFVAIGCSGLPASSAAKSNLQSEAKITMQEARAIALKIYPGKIMKQELEREAGGSGLRYSFDLRRGNKWREVGVDAITGKVIEDTAERPNPRDQ